MGVGDDDDGPVSLGCVDEPDDALSDLEELSIMQTKGGAGGKIYITCTYVCLITGIELTKGREHTHEIW